MDTEAAPVNVGRDPAKISFGKRPSVCLMARVTGTQAGPS